MQFLEFRIAVEFFVYLFICLFPLGNISLTLLPHSEFVTAKLSLKFNK